MSCGIIDLRQMLRAAVRIQVDGLDNGMVDGQVPPADKPAFGKLEKDQRKQAVNRNAGFAFRRRGYWLPSRQILIAEKTTTLFP